MDIKLPSFGEWLSRKDLIQQIFFHAYIQAGAFIIWIIALQVIPYYYILPPMINALVAVAPALIYLEVYRNWDAANKAKTATQYNFTPKLQWSLEHGDDEVFSAPIIRTIKEDEKKKRFYFHIPSNIKLKDPVNAIEYRDIILISPLPFKETFKDGGDGFRNQGGSLSVGPTISGWWVWLCDFKNINGFPELSDDVISNYRVFYNAMSSYDGDEVQRQVGLSPRVREITTETVIDAIKTLDNQNSVKVKLELRDEQSLNRKLVENYEDAATKAISKIDVFWERDRLIRKPPNLWKTLPLKWIAITVIFLALLYVINQRWT